MRRFLSFREFDWALLAMVLLLCTISVLEIYSATLHTKYIGSHTKQIFWIGGGIAAMFLISKIDYHRLLDWVPWAYGFFLLWRGTARWAPNAGSSLGLCNFSPRSGSSLF
jgi:rod shape determining protein RodA